MRQFGAGFSAHIAGAVTKLCWCWKVTRNDGVVFKRIENRLDSEHKDCPKRGLPAAEARTSATGKLRARSQNQLHTRQHLCIRRYQLDDLKDLTTQHPSNHQAKPSQAKQKKRL